jgi:ferritin-like metal-binding protein YciE
MTKSEQKIVQYLEEAHAMELGLVRVLRSQIATTPRGAHRSALEAHLRETRNHAERVGRRASDLRRGVNPLRLAAALIETVIGQSLALYRAPLDLLRGSDGEEKVLKNARETCATEALEIATYTTIARLARDVGDETTAKLAESMRADEQKMLDRVMSELPKLTDAVVKADVSANGSSKVTEAGAADGDGDAGRAAAGRAAVQTARRGSSRASRTARQPRKASGRARGNGRAKGAVASERELAANSEPAPNP